MSQSRGLVMAVAMALSGCITIPKSPKWTEAHGKRFEKEWCGPFSVSTELGKIQGAQNGAQAGELFLVEENSARSWLDSYSYQYCGHAVHRVVIISSSAVTWRWRIEPGWQSALYIEVE